VHVPYNGNSEAVLGIASGQVQAGFLATAGVLPLIAAGRVRALAISSLMRSAIAPNIPTVAESGFPGFDVTFYEVMLAPSGVPESVRALLEQEVRQALQYSDVQEQLRSQALEPMGSTGIEAAARLKVAAEQWRSVITATGLH
jgi:tripartite-type tricarboxylate transporter receptor subunit TctC